MTDGFVQVALDQGGKRIANATVILPAGTVVVNQDGTTTTLGSDTVVYLQKVVLTDPDSGVGATVAGEEGRGSLAVGGPDLEPIEEINENVREMLGLFRLFLSDIMQG